MDPIWNSAPCGVVFFNDDGTVIDANATLLRWLHIPSEERLSKFTDILTIAGQIFYQTHFFPLLKLHGKAEEIFFPLRARTGDTVPMLAYAVRRDGVTQCVLVPVRERQKYEQEILAAKKAAEDAVRNNHELTASKAYLKRQAQELERRARKSEQSNRELLQVSNILFHDLREPIRKIETFSDLIRSQDQISEDTRRAVTTIETACQRMQQLLRALQGFVSVETVNEPVETIDLNAAVCEAYQKIRAKYPDVAADFAAEPLPSIEGFASQITLLFANLFDNAFKFRRPEIRLNIAVSGTLVEENSFQSTSDRYRYVPCAQISISDNGRGIAKDYRRSVFELLKKLDPANPNPGCGLAICKKVVENHYGTISIHPMAPHGTTFKILLPVRFDDVPHKKME
jgi:sigma-B regulation protein RsbU (phosphoserine phosphatase)